MRPTGLSSAAFLVLGAALLASCGKGAEAPDLGGLPFGEDAMFRNPLLDVEKGEWAIYRLMDGKEMRWEVLDVHPRTRAATVQEVMRDPDVDRLVDQKQITFGPNHLLAGFVSARFNLLGIYFDEITVAGRTWLALCIDTASSQLGRVRQWYSTEVPVTGLLLQERVEPGSGRITVMTELEDWSGRTED